MSPEMIVDLSQIAKLIKKRKNVNLCFFFKDSSYMIILQAIID